MTSEVEPAGRADPAAVTRAPVALPGPTPAPVWCPVCGLASERLANGPGGRPLASCPWCGSLERHRLLSLLLRGMSADLAGGRFLEISPSPFTTGLLRDLGPSRLVSLDVDPSADGRTVDVQASLTGLPFADGVFDFVLCLHVLEHIRDDTTAIAELARVLSVTGVGLLQVPWEIGKPTDESPEPVDDAERIARFVRVDHVRQYGGTTLEDRLAAAGLEVERFASADVLGPSVVRTLGLAPAEMTWLIRPEDRDRPDRPSLRAQLEAWVAAVAGPGGDRVPDLLPALVAASARLAAAELETDAGGGVPGSSVPGPSVPEPSAHDAGLAEDVAQLHGRIVVLLGNAQGQSNRIEASRVRERELDERVAQLTADLAGSEQRGAAAAGSARESARVAAVRTGVLERELAAARRSAALWERRYSRLRGRLPIRLAAQVGGPLRAAVRSARHRPDG